MTTIASALSSPSRDTLLSRTRRALGPEGAGLALFVGLAICLVIAALAVGNVAQPLELEQTALLEP